MSDATPPDDAADDDARDRLGSDFGPEPAKSPDVERAERDRVDRILYAAARAVPRGAAGD